MPTLWETFIGIGIFVGLYNILTRGSADLPHNSPNSAGVAPLSHLSDHPPGNAVPLKTIQPFKKVSDYMFSPWDPLNNAETIEFHDADNMPRTDYIMPGGGRVVTYGYKALARSNRPGFPTHGTYYGKVLSSETPITAKTTKKNLNLHSSLWHSQH